MVSVILPDDTLGRQLPEPRVVVRARGYEVRRVGGEGAVPHPALVAREGGLEAVGARRRRVVRVARLHVPHLPNLGGVVGGAGGELLHVWGEEYAGDILLVSVELGDGEDAGALEGLR